MHLQYRKEIDGLRAIAVLSVILFHVKVSGYSGGYVGVDNFWQPLCAGYAAVAAGKGRPAAAARGRGSGAKMPFICPIREVFTPHAQVTARPTKAYI